MEGKINIKDAIYLVMILAGIILNYATANNRIDNNEKEIIRLQNDMTKLSPDRLLLEIELIKTNIKTTNEKTDIVIDLLRGDDLNGH